MKYGYHYTPCHTGSSGPGLWLLIKLAIVAGLAAGVWWVVNAIARATTAAVGAVAGAATTAGPVVIGAVGAVALMFAVAVVVLIIHNNQRPPLIPHDRPVRGELMASVVEESTVEVIDVTPNRRRLDPPRPVYRPLPSRPYAEVPRLAR
jgi:hypothetical protein